MKLFRISLKSVNTWDSKIRNLYVISESKEKAIEHTNQYKNDTFVINKVYYLGYALSGRMFKGGK